MLRWNLEKKTLPLRFVWKISRSAIDSKDSYFISVTDGKTTGWGEISPNQRYGNTPEVIEKQYLGFLDAAAAEKRLAEMDLTQFDTWLDSLGLCKTLRFGAESAWIDWRSRQAGQGIGDYLARNLGLTPASAVPTSFSVPIMDPAKVEEFVQPLGRYHALKIKVDAASAMDMIEAVTRVTSQKLRIDANEAWHEPDSLMRFVESLRGKNIEFIEQPFPAGMSDAYRAVLPRFPYPLIGDESIEHTADFADLKTQFSGVNIKLMKTGGFVRAYQLLSTARKHGLQTMVGCMVETSLGISAALRLCAPSLVDYADLDGFLLIQEDPFGLVGERDGILTLAES